MGRLKSDMMSYRNHNMCSGEATSKIYVRRKKYVNDFFDRLNKLLNLIIQYYLVMSRFVNIYLHIKLNSSPIYIHLKRRLHDFSFKWNMYH